MRKNIFTTTILVFLLISFSYVYALNSTNGEFGTDKSKIYLNWTNNYTDSLEINNLNTTKNITVDIHNTSLTHYITNISSPILVKVNNTYQNESIFILNGSSNTTFFEVGNDLSPGRYFGKIVVTDSSDQNENLTVDVTLDVPLNLSTGKDSFEGNVTNTTSNFFYFNVTSIEDIIGLSVNVSTNSKLLKIDLFDSSGNLKNSTVTNGSTSLDYIFPDFPNSDSLWYLKFSNSTTNCTIPFNATIELFKPSLMVKTDTYPNGTFDKNTKDGRENITFTENLGFNKTISKYFTIENLADYNLSYVVNSSRYLNYSSSYIPFSFNLSDGIIITGDKKTVEINFSISSDEAAQSGIYGGWILINSTNGYPYRMFNLSLYVNLTDQIRVSLLNVASVDGDNWIEDPAHAQNISFYSKVFLINGTEIKDLNTTDFSFSLSNMNKTHTISFSKVSNYTSELYSGGEYKANVTLPSNQLGGYYKPHLSVSYEVGGATLHGSVQNGTLIINDSALWLQSDETDFTIEEEDSDAFKLTVTNYGPKKATGKIEIEESCTGFSIKTSDLKSGCGSVEESSGSSPGFNIDVSEGETCWYEWSFDAGMVSSDKDCNPVLKVSDPHFNHIDIDVTIENVESNQQQGGTSNTTTTTTTTTTIGNVAGEIKITGYPAIVEVVQDDSEKFSLSVKNVGSTSQEDISFSILGISSEWYSFTPSKVDLNPNEEKSFDVTISPPKDAPIGPINVTLKVWNDYVNATKVSSFKILPCESEKIKINRTLDDYRWNYTELRNKMLIWSKKFDTSDLNMTLRSVKEKLDEAENLINEGDYISAKEKLDEVKFLLSKASEDADEIRSIEAHTTSLAVKIVWILVGLVAISIIGIVIYLSLPPREMYKYKRTIPKKIKYKSPSSFNNIVRKLKIFIRSILLKIKLFFMRKKYAL
ncbi:MAG: hypothetical protein J7L45_01570 [Candidatus Aenigmarchaeota archaeon]|nr:hypothetical protein [Candidatus Aenigmarchaeota archaeon]